MEGGAGVVLHPLSLLSPAVPPGQCRSPRALSLWPGLAKALALVVRGWPGQPGAAAALANEPARFGCPGCPQPVLGALCRVTRLTRIWDKGHDASQPNLRLSQNPLGDQTVAGPAAPVLLHRVGELLRVQGQSLGPGSGVGVGVPWTGGAGGGPCGERDCAVPAAGLRAPASNPAASPASRRSKLKGRFMLSDPWGGGRLRAGIEAWHGLARLCSHRLSRSGLCRGAGHGQARCALDGPGSVLLVPVAGQCHPLGATGQGLAVAVAVGG